MGTRAAGSVAGFKRRVGSGGAWPALSLLAVAATAIALLPVLDLRTVPLVKQPFPDSYTYADAAWELAHGHGYITYVNQGMSGKTGSVAKPLPPRYPFGTSAVLAPFTLVFGRPQGAQIGARVIVAFYVVAMITAAWFLGGPLAALVAAVFIRTSPFADTMATLVMSDPLAALLAVLILAALIRRSKVWLVVAGALAGALIDVRLLGLVALPATLLAAGRRRWIALGAALPFVALLGYYQWHTFGSPLKTGYSYWLPHLHQFGLTYVTGQPFGSDRSLVSPHASGIIGTVCGCNPMNGLSNLVFYPSVLSGLLWIYAPPLTGLIGLVTLIRWRHTPLARYALVLIVLNVATLLVYFWQAARFVAPAGSLLLIYSAVGLAGFATWAMQRVRSAQHLVARRRLTSPE